MEMNWLALIVASIAAFIIGFLWYGPVFGKKRAGLMKMTEADLQGSGWKDLVLHFITIIVMIFVHFHVLDAFGTDTIQVALQGAFWTWLGYFFMREIGSIIRSKDQERGLLLLNGAYWLVIMIVVSLVYVLV